MRDYEDLIKRIRLSVENPLVFEAINAIEALAEELSAAKTDIAALLWLDGCCSYCKFAQKVEYSGANRWTCKLGGGAKCQPEWKGTQTNNDGKE